jgi:hypothetical protein
MQHCQSECNILRNLGSKDWLIIEENDPDDAFLLELCKWENKNVQKRENKNVQF